MNHWEESLKCWVENVIIKHNFCPFAKKEFLNNKIRYKTIESEQMEICLENIVQEALLLNSNPEIETTLLIFPMGFDTFDRFLELLFYADEILIKQGFEGVYQIASFHPKYVFEGSKVDDPANFTNRSPHPTLHLIREASLEAVLDEYPNPEAIPVRNVTYARDLGFKVLKAGLERCVK